MFSTKLLRLFLMFRFYPCSECRLCICGGSGSVGSLQTTRCDRIRQRDHCSFTFRKGAHTNCAASLSRLCIVCYFQQWVRYFSSNIAITTDHLTSTIVIFICSDIVIADPSLIEEKRAEATVVFGLNSYRELCGLHFGGITLASLQVLLRCANQGAKRANGIVTLIKSKLEEDTQKR